VTQQRPQRLPHSLLAASLLLGLAACGGGDGQAESSALDPSLGAITKPPATQAQALGPLLADGLASVSPIACSSALACTLSLELLRQPSDGSLQVGSISVRNGASRPGLVLSLAALQRVGGTWQGETMTDRRIEQLPDGSVRVLGGRLGSSGLLGQLVVEDLAGRALNTWPGMPADLAGVFPDGASSVWIDGQVGEARYRLTRGTDDYGGDLAASVALHQTPVDPTSPPPWLQVAEDNPAGLAYTFDAALSGGSGRVTVWRQEAGQPVRLGGGNYSVETTEADSVLIIGPLDAAVLDTLAPEARARLDRGERALLAVVNLKGWTGTLLPAGSPTADDNPPRLNPVALAALLAALDMPSAASVAAPINGSTGGGSGVGSAGSSSTVLGGDSVSAGSLAGSLGTGATGSSGSTASPPSGAGGSLVVSGGGTATLGTTGSTGSTGGSPAPAIVTDGCGTAGVPPSADGTTPGCPAPTPG
jgi:hypothetical protein